MSQLLCMYMLGFYCWVYIFEYGSMCMYRMTICLLDVAKRVEYQGWHTVLPCCEREKGLSNGYGFGRLTHRGLFGSRLRALKGTLAGPLCFWQLAITCRPGLPGLGIVGGLGLARGGSSRELVPTRPM